MQSDILLKYINNECTNAEIEEIVSWINSNSKSESNQKLLQTEWDKELPNDDDVAVDFERLLDRVHHKINLSQNTLEIASPKKMQAILIQRLMRVAAILFLPVLGLLFFSYWQNGLFNPGAANDHWVSISTPEGAKSNFELPDGSKVWLNHNSKLRYPMPFSPTERVVELEGEAFFEVKSNLQRPFQVSSGELAVVATGTAFNVLAYPEDKNLEVTLVSGEVEVQRIQANKNSSLYKMAPKEHLVFQKEERKIIPSIESPEKYIAWKENKIIFENDPIDEVTNRLSRWFNVKFVLEDPKLSE